MAVGRGFTGWGLDVTRHTHSHTTTLDTTPHSDSYILYEVFFQLRLGEKPGCHTGVPQLLDIFNLKKKANYASTIYIRTISACEMMIAATLIITQDSTI